MSAPAVAVILPCYNEAAAIGDVVASFRKALPAAIIYVYDNASTDDTAAVARAAGAVVRFEPEKGKGAAVSRALPMSRLISRFAPPARAPLRRRAPPT
ncbi:MAG: glycosyltransferase [Parvularculaceae bacterium]